MPPASAAASVSSKSFLLSHGFVEHSTSWSPAERALAKQLQLQLQLPMLWFSHEQLFAAAAKQLQDKGGATNKVPGSHCLFVCVCLHLSHARNRGPRRRLCT